MTTWFSIEFSNVYVDITCEIPAILQLETTYQSPSNYAITSVYIYDSVNHTTSVNVLNTENSVWYGTIGNFSIGQSTPTFFGPGLGISQPLYYLGPSGQGVIANLFYSGRITTMTGQVYILSMGLLYGPRAVGLAGTVVSGQSCFAEDTNILAINEKTGKEVYRLVQDLKVGDLVKTYKHGILPIKLIGKGHLTHTPENIWQQSMFVLKKTNDNGLTEDLIITGGHSILVDELSEDDIKKYKNVGITDLKNMKMDDKYLSFAGLSNLFTKFETRKEFNYYHFVVENEGDEEKNVGVWANGVLIEATNEKNFNYSFGKKI